MIHGVSVILFILFYENLIACSDKKAGLKAYLFDKSMKQVQSSSCTLAFCWYIIEILFKNQLNFYASFCSFRFGWNYTYLFLL